MSRDRAVLPRQTPRAPTQPLLAAGRLARLRQRPSRRFRRPLGQLGPLLRDCPPARRRDPPAHGKQLPQPIDSALNYRSRSQHTKPLRVSSVREILIHTRLNVSQNVVHHAKEEGENKDGDEHDHGGRSNLIPTRPGDQPHFAAQTIRIRPEAARPTCHLVDPTLNPALSRLLGDGLLFPPAWDATFRSSIGPSSPCLAGAEGFEPPLAVLETAGLPLNLRP